jgi:hypothetical protein
MKQKLHEMTKEEYESLYRSGFMGEFYPEASGCYEKDVLEHSDGEHFMTATLIKEWEAGMAKKWNELETEWLEPVVKSAEDAIAKVTYQRIVKDGVIDIYDILELYKVYNPAVAHAVKKLLMSGQRGYKDVIQDLEEAKQSITRAIELEKSYREV